MQVERRQVLSMSALGAAGALLNLDFGPEVRQAMAYPKLSPEEAAAEVTTSHPRLMVTDFAALRDRVNKNARLKSWQASLLSTADIMLGTAVQKYELVGGKLPHAPIEIRCETLALAYQLTQDNKYLDRLRKEVKEFAAWPDWNPNHFLDTAGLTRAMALSYDWLYDKWNQSEQNLMVKAICDKGLTPGLAWYKKEAQWRNLINNWDSVVGGGLTMGALAVAQDNSDLAGKTLSAVREPMELVVKSYGPSGSHEEGPDYWTYGTSYLVYWIASMLTATGSADSLEKRQELKDTPYYTLDMTSPLGLTFNYYDSGTNPVRSSELLWFANLLNKPELTDWATPRADASPTPYDILWANPAHLSAQSMPRWSKRKLDAAYRGEELAMMRSTWPDVRGTFFAGKGGHNGAVAHGDLDLGSFVLDSDGNRWGLDLGLDNYGLAGYWKHGPGEGRWNHYTKRPEGHNTLVANPNRGPSQKVPGSGTIITQQGNAVDAFTTFELSGASDELKNWKRGIRLLNGRREFLIQDEFSCNSTTVWWFMHTRADIQVSDDGKKATLTENGETLKATILSGSGASFLDLDAAALWTSPMPDPKENPRTYIRRLAIKLDNTTGDRIAVHFVPGSSKGELKAPTPKIEALSAWKLRVNGNLMRHLDLLNSKYKLHEFRRDVLTYTRELPAGETPPKVTFAAMQHESRLCSYQNATSVPGTSTVTLKDNAGNKNVYAIHFVERRDIRPGVPALASTDDGNIPRNVLDDSEHTRWSADGAGQWIRVDLGSVKTISGVGLSWFKGDKRASSFAIEVSDGGEYKEIFRGAGSGKTNDEESFNFANVQARYVRYMGFGNSANSWNSVTRFTVKGGGKKIEIPFPAPPLHLASVDGGIPDKIALNKALTLAPKLIMSDKESKADMSSASIKYFSSDPSILSVSDTGKLTAKNKEGKVQVAVIATFNRVMRWNTVEVSVVDPTKALLDADNDAMVHAGAKAGENYGKDKTMTSYSPSSANYVRHSYVRFARHPEGTVTKAVLRLRAKTSAGATNAVLAAYAVDANWSQDTINWNNAPKKSGDRISTVAIPDDFAFVTLDVTSHVKKAFADGKDVSFVLVEESTGGTPRHIVIQTMEAKKQTELMSEFGPKLELKLSL